MSLLTQRVLQFRAAVEARMPVAPGPSLLFWLWLSPRLAMRTVLDLRPSYLVWPLAFVNAVFLVYAGSLLMRSAFLGDAWNGILFTVAVIHAVLYMMFVPALPYWVLNRCFKKPGRYRDVQSAILWGAFPVCVLMPFGFPLMTATARFAASGNWLLIIALLMLTSVFLLLWAWAVVILIRCLGEAMRIGTWTSLGLLVLFWVPQSMLYLLTVWPMAFVGIFIGSTVSVLCGWGLGPACALVESV